MAGREARLKPWLLLGLPVLFLLLVAVLGSFSAAPGEAPPRRHEIACSDFKNLIEQGSVEEVVLVGGWGPAVRLWLPSLILIGVLAWMFSGPRDQSEAAWDRVATSGASSTP